jgi:hypothetical protein
VIVDSLKSADRNGSVEHFARLRWQGGERGEVSRRLSFTIPRELSAPPGEGSAFLSACLLQAMRRGEDLEIDAPVSAKLLAATDQIQTIYASWAPSVPRVGVRVAGETAPRARASAMGCFFSRGVDSMYSAAAEQRDRVTHLVFIADLDPINDVDTQAHEVRLAQEAAALLDRPLVVAGSNVRRVADGLLDWTDLVGAGLSAVAQCSDGGLGSMLIPSSSDWTTFGPAGTSPFLDPRYSTENLQVEHGELNRTRDGKVAWLAANRPDLLPLLKVCFRENRPDNCGRCRKCLWTMASLEAAGSLHLASSFPPEIDLKQLSAVRPGDLQARLAWLHTANALEEAGARPELRETIREALRRTIKPPLRERLPAKYPRLRGIPAEPGPPPSAPDQLFRRQQMHAATTVLRGPIDGKET